MKNRQAFDIQHLTTLEISYVKIFKIIFSRWYWLVTIVVVGWAVCWLYLYCTPLTYATNASLKFEEKRAEIAELINVRNIYDKTNKVASEKLVICSRNVLSKAIASLDYNISYSTRKNFKKIDLYPKKPISITTIYKADALPANNDFEYKPINIFEYQLCYNEGCKIYRYEQMVSFPHLKFTIHTPKHYVKDQTIYFKFIDKNEVIAKINRSIRIDDTQNINILSLRFTSQNPYFATDMLNAIIDEYLIFDKVARATAIAQTSTFINSLLKTMSDATKISGQAIRKFKEKNDLTNLSVSLNQTTNSLASIEAEKHTLDIQGQFIKLIEQDLNSNSDKLNYELQGITDPQLSNLLLKYNELVLKKKEYLNTYTVAAPPIIFINDRLTEFMDAIQSNLTIQRKANAKSSAFLVRQIDSIRHELSSIPEKERMFVELQSKFDISQKVYSYLEEKRLEAQIANAAVIPGAVIIDRATYPEQQVYPIPLNTYTLFTLGSLGLGIMIIFFLRVINPYIYHKETIEMLTAIPVIGVVRKHHHKTNTYHQIAALQHPRSLFSESIRFIRSNLDFLAAPGQHRMICLTSEISGEGKSFLSLNLACSLTLLGKKVVLIAGDLRKSTLHKVLAIDNRNGLSRFLSGQIPSNQICHKTTIQNLDFIPSGPTPPNSSELLHNDKMLQLIAILKETYDFIIVDSAPVGLVSDAKPLIKLADINLFILRSGVSKRHFIATPERLKKEFNLSNIAIVLNDFKDDNFYNHYYKNNYLNYQSGGYDYPQQLNHKNKYYPG